MNNLIIIAQDIVIIVCLITLAASLASWRRIKGRIKVLEDARKEGKRILEKVNTSLDNSEDECKKHGQTIAALKKSLAKEFADHHEMKLRFRSQTAELEMRNKELAEVQEKLSTLTESPL